MAKKDKTIRRKVPSSSGYSGSGSSGSYGSSGSGTSSSDSEEDATAIAYRIDREQLGALLGAVRTSRNTYDGDVSTLNSSLGTIDDDSPVVSKMKKHISDMINDTTCDDDYDRVVRAIESALS